jgi:hypothetical protein
MRPKFLITRRLLNQALLSLPSAHQILSTPDMPRTMKVPVYKPDFRILNDELPLEDTCPYYELTFSFDMAELDWVCENVIVP